MNNDLSLELESILEFTTSGLKLIPKKLESHKTTIEKSLGNTNFLDIINSAVSKIEVNDHDWQFVAARTLLLQLYTEAGKNRAEIYDSEPTSIEAVYGEFPKFVKFMVQKGLYSEKLLEYTDEQLEELGKELKVDRDLLFTYIGLRQLDGKYLLVDRDKSVLELPQERWMVVAMTIMLAEKPEDRVKHAKEFYWAKSNLYMTVATPTMANAGKPNGQLSSCFIDTVEDSLDEIMMNDRDTAMVSKNGGGVGIYMGKVRARGSDIQGFEGIASGTTPWTKIINDVGVSVDQLGQRQGAIAVYNDVWHKDIFEFLELGLNNGDERMRARDIFPGLCIPDMFMELIESDKQGRMLTPDAEWHLFDPHEVKQVMGWSLEDFYDEEIGNGTFRKKYAECVANPNLSRTTVPVKKVVQAILTAQLETGHPYMFYRDEANRKNPNKHDGMIYCSNLCTEIFQNMSTTKVLSEEIIHKDGKVLIAMYREPGDYVVCNLSSINLGRAYLAEGVLERLIPIQVRALDNVIDVNHLPLKQALLSNQKNRSVGLGTFGWHHLLALVGIDWDDERSVDFADEVYEKVAYLALKASHELALEKGAYPIFKGSDWETGAYFDLREYSTETGNFDWDLLKYNIQTKGIRNGHVMAVAPNASSAIIAGSTPGIDPFYGANCIYFEEKKDYKLPSVAPDLNEETFAYYYRRNAHYVSQHMTIKQNAKRARHIDQGISMNLYVDSEIKGKDLMELHREVWRSRAKTSYYVRGTANMIDECDSCQ